MSARRPPSISRRSSRVSMARFRPPRTISAVSAVRGSPLVIQRSKAMSRKTSRTACACTRPRSVSETVCGGVALPVCAKYETSAWRMSQRRLTSMAALQEPRIGDRELCFHARERGGEDGVAPWSLVGLAVANAPRKLGAERPHVVLAGAQQCLEPLAFVIRRSRAEGPLSLHDRQRVDRHQRAEAPALLLLHWQYLVLEEVAHRRDQLHRVRAILHARLPPCFL